MDKFDWEFYIFLYDDLKNINNEEEAYNHYINHGLKENRICNKLLYNFFDYNFYIENYDDLKHLKTKNQAFLHYINNGLKENRNFNNDYKNFDTDFYLFLYDNLKNIKNKYDAYIHCVTINYNINIKSLKNIYDNFDYELYLSLYNDLKNIKSKKEAFLHYINNGINENRIISKNEYDNFDWVFYITLYKNFKNKDEAYNHWIKMSNQSKIEKIKCNSYITFIIPTIGRKSLLNTVESLLKLKNNNWKALILFDGVTNEFKDIITDKRFYILEIEKNGVLEECGKAGLVRNIGMNYISHTRWIGFVDDDDTLSPDYIDNLKIEDKLNSNLNICVFRMIDINNNILPPKSDFGIHKRNIGISFAIRNNICRNILFKNDNYEDYYFLKECEFKKHNIILSPYISYFVRSNPFDVAEISKDINRITINF